MHRIPLFAYGFRPFFLASGSFALVIVPAWLWVYGNGFMPIESMPPQIWHAHEMLFGFVAAAIAGFLLTAVPNWTGHRGFAGVPLMILSLAWVAGRLGLAFARALPLPLVIVLELTFLPLLAGFIAPAIVRARNRNTPMLGILAALWLADAAFMLAIARVDYALASKASLAAINIVLALVTIIGGRIVPAFTANALRQSGRTYALRTHVWIERALPAVMVAVIGVDALRPAGTTAGVIAAVAAVLHGVRLAGWTSGKLLDQPIVWSLHLAYLWLPLGFLLKSIAIFTGAGWAQSWQHAFGIGVFAGMILAVSTRASLGHTGRPLVVRPMIAVAYALIALTALLRIGASALGSRYYWWGLLTVSVSWTAAFALFLIVYGPILTSPRLDGKEG